MTGSGSGVALLAPPYTRLETLEASSSTRLRARTYPAGSAVVWLMRAGAANGVGQVLRDRPGGLALIVILPPEKDLATSQGIATALHRVRPQGVLPHHTGPSCADLTQVLRRPPIDLPAEVVDYVRWRGFVIDRDTVRLLRRILDLSAELRSVSAVSRSLYLSRRALGRRLASRGLPVPSHWLQMGRLLRIASRLQNSEATISSIAFELGYPDGFSLSNQMERLTGHRPSEVRKRLGWEWLLESWLRREAAAGGLRPAPDVRGPSGSDPLLASKAGGSPEPRARARHSASGA